MARFVLPSLFPQYEKLIVCDVDVVFTRDMSESYFSMNTDDPYYLAIVKEPTENTSSANVTELIKLYQMVTINAEKAPIPEHFLSPQQWQILSENAFYIGFSVFNLKAWREDNLEEQCIEFFRHKGHRLCAPEQDTLVLLCHERALKLPHIYDVCYGSSIVQDPKEVVMWHFSGDIKPWEPQNFYFHTTSLWIRALLRTPLATTYFENYDRWLADKDSKKLSPYLEPLLTKKVLCAYVLYKVQKILKGWYTKLYFWWKLRKT